MIKFELSKAFHIGHEKIDADHRDLVRILNEMVDVFEAGDIPGCQQTWHLFCQRIEQHFGDEIKIMTDFGYGEDDHDAGHQKILDRLIEMKNQAQSLNDWERCLIEMRSELLVWILKHDLLFAEHLVSIGYNPV